MFVGIWEFIPNLVQGDPARQVVQVFIQPAFFFRGQ